MTLVEPHIPAVAKRPSRRRAGRFFALVLGLLLLLEVVVRLAFPLRNPFWAEVDQIAAAHPVQIIFVGTSRVAAAVDAATFAQTLPPSSNSGYVLNAGMGYTTPAEYYMALRNSLERTPASFQHCTVFIEIDGGIPDPLTWQQPWAHSARPETLIPFLRRSDLTRFYAASHPLEEKLQLSLDWLLRPSALYTQRHALGNTLYTDTQTLLANALQFLAPPPPPPPATADLTHAGGIRNDSEGVAAARQVAHEYAQQMLTDQQPIDWDNTIIADLVRLAQAHKVQIIFFEIPLHTLHQSMYQTPIRRADAEHFRVLAAQWHTPILTPEFASTDDDFPDIWHLRHSRAPDYTAALSAAYQTDHH